jgi:hypothetical protein
METKKSFVIFLLCIFLLSYMVYIVDDDIDLNTQKIKRFTIVNFIGAVVLIILLNMWIPVEKDAKPIMYYFTISYLLFNILNIKYVYDNNIKLVRTFNIINAVYIYIIMGMIGGGRRLPLFYY